MLLRIYKTCDCAEKFVQGTEVKPPSYLAVQKFMYFYVHIVCPCLSVRYADNGPQQKKKIWNYYGVFENFSYHEHYVTTFLNSESMKQKSSRKLSRIEIQVSGLWYRNYAEL